MVSLFPPVASTSSPPSERRGVFPKPSQNTRPSHTIQYRVYSEISRDMRNHRSLLSPSRVSSPSLAERRMIFFDSEEVSGSIYTPLPPPPLPPSNLSLARSNVPSSNVFHPRAFRRLRVSDLALASSDLVVANSPGIRRIGWIYAPVSRITAFQSDSSEHRFGESIGLFTQDPPRIFLPISNRSQRGTHPRRQIRPFPDCPALLSVSIPETNRGGL